MGGWVGWFWSIRAGIGCGNTEEGRERWVGGWDGFGVYVPGSDVGIHRPRDALTKQNEDKTMNRLFLDGVVLRHAGCLVVVFGCCFLGLCVCVEIGRAPPRGGGGGRGGSGGHA